MGHRLGGLGRQAVARDEAALEQPVGVALVEPCVSLGVALKWLWGRNQLAINTLCGGLGVALGGCARAQNLCPLAAPKRSEGGSAFFILPSAFLGRSGAGPVQARRGSHVVRLNSCG